MFNRPIKGSVRCQSAAGVYRRRRGWPPYGHLFAQGAPRAPRLDRARSKNQNTGSISGVLYLSPVQSPAKSAQARPAVQLKYWPLTSDRLVRPSS